MAVVDALATVALTVVIPPFLIVLVTVLVLASLGKSLGLRQRYVQFLLKVFEVSGEHGPQRATLYSASLDLKHPGSQVVCGVRTTSVLRHMCWGRGQPQDS